MCNHHHSKEILRKAHYNHTYGCCPEIPEIASKIEALTALEGSFPVFNLKMNEIIELAKYHIMHSIDYHVRKKLFYILDSISFDDFSNNVVPKSMFDDLRSAIESELNKKCEFPFQLVKKSSPKLSNILLSILQFRYENEDVSNHELMKKFNDRGVSKLDRYEMLLTTEPHRIVGMSAFGKFTSCQDWIEKDEDHEYHHYTHQAWANLKDETVGILYIREKDDDQPSKYDTNVQDMLARSLIRVVKLDSGLKVIFLHKIYAHSPYDKYLMDSITEWEKGLPEDYRVIHMYKEDKSTYREGKNKYGVFYSGFQNIRHDQEDCAVYGCSRTQCEDCNDGRVECYDCNGRGEWEEDVDCDCDTCDGSGGEYDENNEWIDCEDCGGRGYTVNCEWVTCDTCDGEGYYDCDNCRGTGWIEDDQSEYYPYNDHACWIGFGWKGIDFEVPKYLVNWDVEPKEEEPTLTPTQESIVGKQFIVKSKTPAMNGFEVGDVVTVSHVSKFGGWGIEIQKGGLCGYCATENLEIIQEVA